MEENEQDIKRDFADFAKKIAKLESFKHEISSLDTKGFENEVSVIKAKLNDVDSIPEVEVQIHELEEKIIKKQKVKPQEPNKSGFLVDPKYNDFVKGVKDKLNMEIKSKKEPVHVSLKTNLDKQKQVFSKRYLEMNEEFHRRYKDKVNKELEKDVKSRFNSILEDKVQEEKKKVIDSLLKEYSRKIHESKKNLIQKLELEYKNKKEDLAKDVLIKGDVLKSKISEVDKEKSLLKQKEQNFDRDFKRKLGELKNKIYSAFSSKFNQVKRQSDINTRQKEQSLKSKLWEIAEEKKRLKQKETNFDRDFKRKLDEAKSKMYSALSSKFDEIKKQSEEIVRKKEQEIRPKLEREYNEKLKKQSMVKEMELEKKKKELEMHIRKQAKELFG
ncbi:hypothetical protein HY448_02535 [Candidatus Pacearchaeota archaeon]|nr:hypothetical protein [Candidatus Pacearchaeota archaeon]